MAAMSAVPKLTLVTHGPGVFSMSAGEISFQFDIISGSGSVAVERFSLDGTQQTVTSPLKVNLAAGTHDLEFLLAFQHQNGIAAISEALTPPHRLLLVDGRHPNAVITIRVS